MFTEQHRNPTLNNSLPWVIIEENIMKKFIFLVLIGLGVFNFCSKTDKTTETKESASSSEAVEDSEKYETPEWLNDVDDIDPWDLMDPQ